MKVDAVIAGVHKCGTTALLQTLVQHPGLMTHVTGQWPYFLMENDYRDAYPRVLSKFFPAVDGESKIIVRDMSLYLEPMALSRLDELSPGVKVVLIIKDPVERAYSAYCYAKSRGLEDDEDFSRIIAAQADGPYLKGRPLICNYIRMGFYHSNLAALQGLFPRDRIMTVLASDLKSEPVATCNQIFQFLELPQFEVTPITANQTRRTRSRWMEVVLREDSSLKHLIKKVLPLGTRVSLRRALAKVNATSDVYPPMRDDDRRTLQHIFRLENQKLSEEYGINFEGRAHW